MGNVYCVLVDAKVDTNSKRDAVLTTAEIVKTGGPGVEVERVVLPPQSGQTFGGKKLVRYRIDFT